MRLLEVSDSVHGAKDGHDEHADDLQGRAGQDTTRLVRASAAAQPLRASEAVVPRQLRLIH